MDAEELTGSLKKLVMWYKVKELKSKGLNKTQIARCLGINRNTVRKYQSMSESEFMNSQSYRRNYNHKLDPYEDFVHKSLDSHPYLSSSQIRDWLREQYEDFPDVGQKTVYTYVQYIRRKYHISKRVGHGNRQYEKQPDTAYGEYAQVDFGERWMYDKEHHPVKVYFYAIVLCRSRYKYIYFSRGPFTTALTVYAHELSFAYLGGKPKKIIYDQDKVLIVNENLGDVLLTREFHAFVNEQHFQPVFCRKSDPESKGKIENVVKYVKYNFLRGRTFHSIDQLNKEALEWLERTGNGNEHSLTHLIPSEEFQIERNCLQPYHGIPTEPRQKMKEYYVRKDNTICYHSNFYTLPCGTCKGQSTTVWVQESEEERLEIFDKETGKQITSHPLCKEKGKTVSNMAHHRVRNVPREDMEKRIVDYAGGDSIASEWMNGLRAGKPRYYWDNLNHILRFMRTFSRETFHEAMEICLDRGAYNALMLTDTARSIQKRKKEKPADLPPMSTATIPTVAQEMPEKTNINQYSSIFK